MVDAHAITDTTDEATSNKHILVDGTSLDGRTDREDDD